jgi:HTH-type transcriptional regulator/antitoxin HigA
MKSFRPAQAFPPGEYLREELESRGWSQGDLAKIIGRPIQLVNQIINNKKRITAETALALSAALGTTAELWVNLQSGYDLLMARKPSPTIAKRATAFARN